MGGFYLDSSDILENGQNIKISQDGTALANGQIYFGALAATDVTTPTYITRTFNGYISGTISNRHKHAKFPNSTWHGRRQPDERL